MGLGLKSRAKDILNHIKATLKVGDYWYWVEESDLPAEIPIKPLVYPLRYDILIRKSFFDFYTENIQVFEENPDAFVELAEGHEYYKWFTKVLMVRYEEKYIGDEQRTHELFSEWVHKAAALHNSIKARGFDLNFPIIPVTGETILPSTQGNTSGGKYFMGDGCHRLACLMSQGYTSLPRQMVRVKCFRNLSPFDNTSLLEEHLSIDWSAYIDSSNGNLS